MVNFIWYNAGIVMIGGKIKNLNLGYALTADGAFGTTKIRSSKDYTNEKRNLSKMSVSRVNGDSVFA